VYVCVETGTKRETKRGIMTAMAIGRNSGMTIRNATISTTRPLSRGSFSLLLLPGQKTTPTTQSRSIGLQWFWLVGTYDNDIQSCPFSLASETSLPNFRNFSSEISVHGNRRKGRDFGKRRSMPMNGSTTLTMGKGYPHRHRHPHPVSCSVCSLDSF
jgi:hypothetical protein